MGTRMMTMRPHLYLVAHGRRYGVVTSAARPVPGRRATPSEIEAAADLAFYRANPHLLGAEVELPPEPARCDADDYQFSA